MLTPNFIRRARSVLASCLIAAMMFGCGGGGGPSGPDTTPELPPAESMVIPFQDFLASGAPAPVERPPTEANEVALAKENFNYAAGSIFFWNVAITVTVAVPVASFLAAFQNPIEFKGDATWESSYDFQSIGGVKHTAVLQAKLVSDGVEWKMLISKENSFQDFLWYSGFSNLENTEGNWLLNQGPEKELPNGDPAPFLNIEWHHDSQASTADVKYTFVVPDAPQNGSWIFYGITNQEPYDAFYTLFGSENSNQVAIEWNRTNKDGHVKSQQRFGDEQFHCWDTLANGLADMDCQ